MKTNLFSLFALLSALTVGASQAHASINLVDHDQWKIDFSGFVELDMISDSTRSLGEVAGNSPVASSTALAGQLGRTAFSMRDSRLNFTINAPEYNDWKTRGVFEVDWLGFDPAPGANNTEAGFYNNATMRQRHLYFATENSGLQILAGQTWGIFGWQPYYFLPTSQPSPEAGMIYSRTPQIKLMKTLVLEDSRTLQFAGSLSRPPQRDSDIPSLDLGARLAFNGLTSGYAVGSSAATAQPLSVGISGTYRQFRIPTYPTASPVTSDSTRLSGGAIALDTLIPIVSSPDGKETAGTVTFSAEYTRGTGDADHFANWTAGSANPMSTASSSPDKNIPLDAGYGGFDATSGNFYLFQIETYNAGLQYHLRTENPTWVSLGYGQLHSSNVANVKYPGTAVAYDTSSTMFANINHTFAPFIRGAFEYAHYATNYIDSTSNTDDRFQVTTWFVF